MVLSFDILVCENGKLSILGVMLSLLQIAETLFLKIYFLALENMYCQRVFRKVTLI